MNCFPARYHTRISCNIKCFRHHEVNAASLLRFYSLKYSSSEDQIRFKCDNSFMIPFFNELPQRIYWIYSDTSTSTTTSTQFNLITDDSSSNIIISNGVGDSTLLYLALCCFFEASLFLLLFFPMTSICKVNVVIL